MFNEIKKATLLCLAVLLGAVQFQAQEEGAFKKFAGTYAVGHGYGGSTHHRGAEQSRRGCAEEN